MDLPWGRITLEFLALDVDSSDLLFRVAEATGVEVRGKHNDFVKQGNYGWHTGASCSSPVINIMRDSRWGRNQVIVNIGKNRCLALGLKTVMTAKNTAFLKRRKPYTKREANTSLLGFHSFTSVHLLNVIQWVVELLKCTVFCLLSRWNGSKPRLLWLNSEKNHTSTTQHATT